MLEICDRATHVYGKETRGATRPPSLWIPFWHMTTATTACASWRQHIAMHSPRNSFTRTWQASVNTALLAQRVDDARGGGSRTAHGWSMARIAWCLPSIAQCVGSSTQCACTRSVCVCACHLTWCPHPWRGDHVQAQEHDQHLSARAARQRYSVSAHGWPLWWEGSYYLSDLTASHHP
jgi:hypothetical protein